MNLGRCHDCNAEIRWLLTKNNKRLAVDPDANDKGNVVVDRIDLGGNEHCRVLGRNENTTLARLMPHIASCSARKH